MYIATSVAETLEQGKRERPGTTSIEPVKSYIESFRAACRASGRPPDALVQRVSLRRSSPGTKDARMMKAAMAAAIQTGDE